MEVCPRSWPKCGLNGTPVERSQIGAWSGHHHGYAGSGGEKTGGRRCRRAELSRGDRSLACTWARLDGGKEMRNRERAVGYGWWLGVCALAGCGWRDRGDPHPGASRQVRVFTTGVAHAL